MGNCCKNVGAIRVAYSFNLIYSSTYSPPITICNNFAWKPEKGLERQESIARQPVAKFHQSGSTPRAFLVSEAFDSTDECIACIGNWENVENTMVKVNI